MFKWRIVLGGLAAAGLLGTFAASPAFASTATVGQAARVSQPAAPAPGSPAVSALTGVLPAVGAAAGALLGGVGSLTTGVSNALVPALGPAVSGLTAPLDGISQDVGNLAGAPVLGALVAGVPALPDAGALLGDLNGLVNGTPAAAGR